MATFKDNNNQKAGELIQSLLDREEIDLEESKRIEEEILKFQIKETDRKHHRFFYEIRPIIKVANQVNRENEGVRIKFCASQEEFDGVISYGGKSKKIECSRAIDGRNEGLQSEHLKRFGRAPANQKIVASGTKHNRDMEEQLAEFHSKEDSMRTLEELLYTAYKDKNKEKYQYFWLVITFDDWIRPYPEDLSILCDELWDSRKLDVDIFERIFIIGDSMRFIWDSSKSRL